MSTTYTLELHKDRLFRDVGRKYFGATDVVEMVNELDDYYVASWDGPYGPYHEHIEPVVERLLLEWHRQGLTRLVGGTIHAPTFQRISIHPDLRAIQHQPLRRLDVQFRLLEVSR